MSKLVYPWDDSNFGGTPADRSSVERHLLKMKYPLSLMKKEPPLKVRKAVDLVVNEHTTKGNWVLLLSDSHSLLQALAIYVPVVHSLTTLMSCRNTSTTKLVSLFSLRPVSDEFSSDPAGEEVHRLKKADCLVWENLTDPVPFSGRMAGRFTDLLSARSLQKCSTVFTLSYSGTWNDRHTEKMMEDVEAIVGTSSMSIINERSTYLRFTVGRELPKMEVLKL